MINTNGWERTCMGIAITHVLMLGQGMSYVSETKFISHGVGVGGMRLSRKPRRSGDCQLQ